MHLLHLSFIYGKEDSSLFTLQAHNGIIILLLYVDDIVITGSNASHVSELVRQLGKEFVMKDLGLYTSFLQLRLSILIGGIHLSQSEYAIEMLDKTRMTFAKVVATPLAQKHGLHESVGSLVETSFYRMIVESLQYLTLTRPDITHVVNLASQFVQNPKNGHLQGVKRIFRYI